MDELNHAIIGQLTANARATFAEVGAAVGLSAPAVKRRVDAMLARAEQSAQPAGSGERR